MQVLRDDLYKPWFVGESDWGFEILDGEFSGLVVQIESVEFSDKNDGTVDLKFHVIKQPEDERNLNVQDELFNQTVELIVNDILREAIKIHEQAGTDDSKESSPQ